MLTLSRLSAGRRSFFFFVLHVVVCYLSVRISFVIVSELDILNCFWN